jgi:ATP-dependent protease ClpP protease subunit
MARLNRDIIDKFYEQDIDVSSKTLYLGGGSDDNETIDAVTAAKIIKGLHLLDKIKPDEPLTIIMNCHGGDTQHGMAIYDAIKNCTSEIHIKVFGSCMSMAVWILQAADRRFMSKHSKLMIHVGTVEYGTNHPRSTKAWIKDSERDEILFEDILLENIREKHPDYTRQKIRNDLVFDKIFNAQEAVDLGLADYII